MTRMFFALFLAIAAFAAPAMAQETNVDFAKVVAEIQTAGNQALAAYEPSKGEDVGEAFSDLYFDVFEGSGMEMAVALADPGLKTQLESLFAQLIGKATHGAPKNEVLATWNALSGKLDMTAKNQSGAPGGFLAAVMQSFLILLREGFEALLLVTALVAYLNRSGNEERVKYIWQGVGAALVASIATAWFLTVVIKVTGEGKEALEGMTMLIASAVLFYVSYWLFAKREADRWQAYVRGQIDKAVTGNRMFTLAFAAFLAVYREGAETVLFYQALLAGNAGQGTAIAGGFVAAVICLIALYWVMRSASLKLPLGLFFTVTAILLYYLAVLFAGKGMLELQGAHWVSITPIVGIPSISWLGVFPTIESLGAQALLIAPLPIVFWWWARKRKEMVAKAGVPLQ